MSVVVTRLRAWMTVFFDELWRLIPAQPILFPFFFISGLLAAEFPPTAPHLAVGWVALSIVSPALVLASWWMIYFRRGFLRYWGFWIRTVGDTGQLISLVVGIAIWLGVLPPPYIAILVGISVFVGALVVRDFLALWLVEQVATKLYRDVHSVAAR